MNGNAIKIFTAILWPVLLRTAETCRLKESIVDKNPIKRQGKSKKQTSKGRSGYSQINDGDQLAYPRKMLPFCCFYV